MEFAFPGGLHLLSNAATLTGMRGDPFININGEPFGRPMLNGAWQIRMQVLAKSAQSKLGLSAFVTAMQIPHATCMVPVRALSYPADAAGRPLSASMISPEFGADHMGFAADRAEGYELLTAASHRDSWIDLVKPAASQLMPGHYLTIGDRLYQVIRVSALGESETAVRVSVLPNIRGSHAAGTPVVIDRLQLRCRLQDGDQFGRSIERHAVVPLTFIEAF